MPTYQARNKNDVSLQGACNCDYVDVLLNEKNEVTLVSLTIFDNTLYTWLLRLPRASLS